MWKLRLREKGIRGNIYRVGDRTCAGHCPRCLLRRAFNSSSAQPMRLVIVPILQVETWRLREVKGLTKSHTAKWQNRAKIRSHFCTSPEQFSLLELVSPGLHLKSTDSQSSSFPSRLSCLFRKSILACLPGSQRLGPAEMHMALGVS